ncbi:hypothetical protein ABH932_006993 [Streptacidiphilus sp. MAP5-52]
MFLFLHTLATNRLARYFTTFSVASVIVIGYALVHGNHDTSTIPTQPSSAVALPTCTSTPATASTQDCLSQVEAWCSINQPSRAAADCATDALVAGVIKG